MKRNILKEYAPDFAGDYSPGDASMKKPTGNGVQSRNVKKMKASSDTKMKDHGDAFGNKKKRETVAMCDVDEDGVEHEPQGKHISKQGNPLEGGSMKEVGRNWPTKPKNSGGHIEPVEGSRYSDGGILNSSMSEWSVDNINELIEEDADLLELFDRYAASNNVVTLEGFRDICEANGINISLDETSMRILATESKKFVFEEEDLGMFRVVNEYMDTSDFDFGGSKPTRSASPKSLPSMHQEESDDGFGDEFGDDEDDEFSSDDFDDWDDDEFDDELADDEFADDEEFDDEFDDSEDAYDGVKFSNIGDAEDKYGDMSDGIDDLGDDMFDDTL